MSEFVFRNLSVKLLPEPSVAEAIAQDRLLLDALGDGRRFLGGHRLGRLSGGGVTDSSGSTERADRGARSVGAGWFTRQTVAEAQRSRRRCHAVGEIMALRATCVDNGQEIDLDRADAPSMAGLLDELHRRTTRGDRPRPGRVVLECREHDGPDGPYHGAWVYLRRDRHGRWVLAHFDRDNYADHVAAGMTDQHRWQQDYWQRAGDAAGYATAREKHLPGVRLDVAIYGPTATIGVEVQHSALSRRAVLTRTTKARGHGVTSLWSGDKPAAPPDWAYRVPTVLTNELPERYAPRGTWTVVNGLRTLVPTRCARPRFHDSSYEGFGGICPATNRRSPCGGWHARFVPTFGVTVDDVAEQAPAGALIPLTLPHWRSPRVYIVTDADHELYGELATGTYSDPERATQDAAQASEVGEIGPCRVVMPHQAAARTLSTAPDTPPSTIPPAAATLPILDTPAVVETALWPPTTIPTTGLPAPDRAPAPVPKPVELSPPAPRPTCSRCGNELFLVRPERTECARCKPDQVHRLRTTT